MAEYKVPQDVEADDKLIGPFSFRQFVYLIIVAMALFLAYGLGQVFLGLALIPLPVIIFFGALALPLRKDQPMEIYLAAMVSYYLKPRQRMWDPDGVESLIEIVAPKTIEVNRTKDISQTEAQKRLSYLAQIVDSRGWAVRGPGAQAPNSSLNSDIYFEAQQVQDILDTDNSTSQSFDAKLDKSDGDRLLKAMQSMTQQPSDNAQTTSTTVTPPIESQETPTEKIEFNPYPNSIVQSVVQPIEAENQIQPEASSDINTSEIPVSADIINLASNEDLSIEAIAREAKRIQEKQDLKEEVVISLR